MTFHPGLNMTHYKLLTWLNKESGGVFLKGKKKRKCCVSIWLPSLFYDNKKPQMAVSQAKKKKRKKKKYGALQI